MSKVIENYVLQDVIGSGQYGKVYRAKNMKNDQIVAIKVVKLEKFREVPKLHEFTINEIQTLSKIDNQNIVKFIEMLKTQNNMYLIYDFCNGDTLEALLQKRKFLTEPETMKIFAQILNAFRSLVRENILHRDLKPSNILFHDQIVKVADFGFCKSLLHNNDLTQTMVGSPIYMAPEVLKGCSYNCKADVWSLGVVLYECLFGFCPFEDKSIARLIMQIDNKEITFPKHVNQLSRKCEELIRSMLQVDPRKRVDWQQLMQITFYEEPSVAKQITCSANTNPIQNLPQMLKKQASTNQVLQDRTNMTNNQPQQQQQQDFQNLRVLLRERSKIIFLAQMVSFLLEQNTVSAVQLHGSLSFSQKTAIIAYFLMKLAQNQTEVIKKQLDQDHRRESRWEEFQGSNEYKQFNSTFQRESEQLLMNIESFKNEAQKVIRHMQQNDLTTQIRNELMSPQFNNLKLYTSLLISYIEESRERQVNLTEDLQQKLLVGLIDLLETSQLNEFFDKNLSDVNIRFNDQRYFEQMRKMPKETLTDILNQRLVNAKIKCAK
ncbi:unnamed protein product (macronuclear) [Paramecium tetraurelia]|uniref:Protein kinase domain-containing protein n=1 Tax=Paramecium tetraurelia TaxID=5888 RepID=A0CKP0_PARTE|nr:uncharacterized protein GSPATT00001071001 [Paramecium tetraurelia]CAK71357.1 unnamed protein product [Paramecium tetraurelia]|eukprot:XP_001438754.1 hypothetical protein (macronuclear) [Paramecium tetraurelia strain d4-2]